MSNGRTIKLFLVDGTPLGLVTAEIPNWTGHILSAPRTRLSEALSRDEAGRTGIYFLVGEEAGRLKVYVGEGDCISVRIKAHAKDEDKEFWERVCLVTSKDFNLTKAHVRYLESRLVEITAANSRADVINATQPIGGSLPESDRADMEFFVAQLQMILPTLGLNFLSPKPALPDVSPVSPMMIPSELPVSPAAATAGAVELFLSHASTGVQARAVDVDGELTVLKGSLGTTQQNAQNSYGGLREQLILAGKLQIIGGDKTEFIEDVVFPSASAAAAVINNRNSAGPREWKLRNGLTLREWRDSLIDLK
ncbi:protein of unknown function [Granulicella rosea]|uniref:DUF4357 domain-containing protein n=1 Tax=Granulicella rosea TaxID=474952 RepID=A0A239DBQ7_9BACT|nr:GIY-YIG nuclease family protein [Granulicella rosea]SNS29291.1 protein of unknown function [Granulicella rosea]